jgi:hypothetical protein
MLSHIKLRDMSSRLQHHIDTGGMQTAKVVSLRWSVNQVLQPADAPIHVLVCKEHAPMMHYTYTRRWEQNNSYVTEGYSLDLFIHERQ